MVYLWGAILSVFYILDVIILVCVVLIVYRLLRLRKATSTPWRQLLVKQFRLMLIWVYHFVFVLIWTIHVGYITYNRKEEIQARSMQVIEEYIGCVMMAGNADNCNFDELPYSPYAIMVILRVMLSFYPIFLFLIFGARGSLLLFWKEYFARAWKNKRL